MKFLKHINRNGESHGVACTTTKLYKANCYIEVKYDL